MFGMIGSQVVDLIKDQLPDLPNEQAQALVEAVNEAIPAIRDAIAEEVADPYNQGYVTGLIIWEIIEWAIIAMIAALTAGAGAAAAAAPKLALSAARWTKRGIKIGQDMIARLRQLVSDLADQMILKGAASRATFNAKAVGDELLESALNKGSKNAADATKVITDVPSTVLVARILSKINLYPKVIDPRTGRNIPFPSSISQRVDKSLRVPWNSKKDKAAFIAEWHRRGYARPNGGWGKYDIHHIHPREFGGTNDFWNLVPVERKTHQTLFNSFWREFLEL